MGIEDFYSQFDDLPAKINNLERAVNVGVKLTDGLCAELNEKREIVEILNGLKRTPKEKDPGKYRTAYYFVKEINDDNIAFSDKPNLHRPCPECGVERPVLMAYAQTYDSPDGDTWEKEAFLICEDRIHKIGSVNSSY